MLCLSPSRGSFEVCSSLALPNCLLECLLEEQRVVLVAVHAAAAPGAEPCGVADVLVQAGINLGALERLAHVFSNEITHPIRNSPIHQWPDERRRGPVTSTVQGCLPLVQAQPCSTSKHGMSRSRNAFNISATTHRASVSRPDPSRPTVCGAPPAWSRPTHAPPLLSAVERW